MLFWLRKNTHKLTWIHVAGISTVSHIATLMWFFFILKERGSKLSLVVTADLFNNDIQFVVEPMKKPKPVGKAVVQSKQKQKKAESKKLASKTTKTTVQKDVPKKVATPKATIQQEAATPKSHPAEKKEIAKPEPVGEAVKEAIEEPKKYELATNAIGAHAQGLLEEFK